MYPSLLSLHSSLKLRKASSSDHPANTFTPPHPKDAKPVALTIRPIHLLPPSEGRKASSSDYPANTFTPLARAAHKVRELDIFVL